MLASATANRKNAETLVPISPPTSLNAANRLCSATVAAANASDGEHDDRRMAEREEEADRDRPLAVLHQLAGDVVDRRDVVGVDRMPQPERVGEKRRAEQHRVARGRRRAPRPRPARFAMTRIA